MRFPLSTGQLSDIPWRILAASSTGVSHRNSGRGCDDAYAVGATETCLIVAVADGAGSAEHSAIGARYAVEWAVAAATQELVTARVEGVDELERILRLSVSTARAQLDALSSLGGPTPNELAATLIVVLASRDFVAAAQVGDGAVVLRLQDGTITALTVPERFEYLNQTTFITSPNALDTLAVSISTAAVRQFVVMTDGLQGLAFDLATDNPFIPFFEPLFSFAEGATASDVALFTFLESDRVNESTDDDKTVVLVTRGP